MYRKTVAAALAAAALSALLLLPDTAPAPTPTPAPAAAGEARAAAAPAAPAARPVATADPAATVGTAVRINGRTYIPCATEDYDGPAACFWDAGARGNGMGHSFTWDGTTLRYAD
jgi:hypothetical protein